MESTSKFKMGSLFDGSGGFPLASMVCGIEPVWASEIEPFPIRVTRARFPNMKHYGDISKIDVSTLETVDLISGGSPCQDMSVAGKRQGMSKQCPKCEFKVVGNAEIKECPECGAELEYTRSGLFMDQIRIVKEMRKKDELEQLRSGRTNEHIRPRFMLWENVTGAFSSNKGEDFRAVLEETAKIKDPAATIPRPPKGKWNNAGLIVGDGYSIAWRVLDAQYWGVPQRRRRIALVADFGGQCAGEILFKRDGLSRNFTESRKAWQGTAGYITQGTGEAGEPFCYNGENLTSPINKQNPQPGDPCHTLGTDPRNYAMIPQYSAGFCPEQSEKARGIGYEEGKSPTLRAGVVPATIKEEQYSVDFGRTADRIQMNADKSVTLLGEGGGAGAKTGLYCLPKQPQTIAFSQNQRDEVRDLGSKAGSIMANPGMKQQTYIMQETIPIQDQATKKAYGICSYASNSMKSDNPHSGFYEADTSRTIDLNGGNPACNQGGIAICEPVAYSLQGNMIGREDHNGQQGSGVNEDVAFTLNATDRHAVVYSVDEKMGNTYVWDNQANTLAARDYKQPQAVVYGIDRAGFNQGENALYDFSVLNDQAQTLIARGPNGVCHENKTYQQTTGPLMANSHPGSYTGQDAHNDMFVANEYIVRRLTPLECSRLQGFPDWWCDGLQNEKPNGHEIAFWRGVFETHREIVTGATKPKTDKQIIKWLKEEPNDGAMYKMWGNGIALPCFLYVIEGIKEVLERTTNSNSSTTASIEN